MDPATSSWASAPAMPVAMYQGDAAGADGTFFIVGGQPYSLDCMYAYTIATSTWGQLPAIPTSTPYRPYDLAAAASSTKVYAVGGYDASIGAVSDVYGYEISTSTWDSLPALPKPMYRGQADVIGSVLWVTGDQPGTEGNLWSYTPGR